MTARLTYEAVQSLYQKHGSALLVFGISILGEKSAAEDVLHQVFVKLLGRSELPADPRPYLFKAVRNAALNRIRSSARLTSLDGQEWLVRPAGNVNAVLEIEKAMAQLPLEQREVVAMRIWAEMTSAEVAAVLEIPENTAASRYRYALAKLRDLLRNI